MALSKLTEIRQQTDALAQNRLLYECLSDDDERARLYAQLRAADWPPLRFKSVMRPGGDAPWPSETVYLLSARADIEEALQLASVQPYAELDSGGRFMLGLDDPTTHAPQRAAALNALAFDKATITRCVGEAIQRAMVLPQKNDRFDLVADVAQQAAVRLIAIVFGFPARAHVYLERAMLATYTRLTFNIIGRHFVPEDGQPSSESTAARELRDKLDEFAWKAARGENVKEWWDDGLINPNDQPTDHAGARLGAHYGADNPLCNVVVLGLMAGTVGNVTSAIANTVDTFFRRQLPDGRPMIDAATQAARRNDEAALAALATLVEQALAESPPAPFLARQANAAYVQARRLRGAPVDIPQGAHLLLAMGAQTPVDKDLMFGGDLKNPGFMHSCVGRHLAWPLIHETVRQLMQLPGLARVLDPEQGQPMPLIKRWGAICTSFPLRFQRDRRLNQQPLFVVLPIKAPVAVNAAKLEALTRAGAPVVERALRDARNVHFAWFGLIEGGTHLAMYTVYDGSFEAYVEHFALKVPLFDAQFEYLDDAPPTPIQQHPKEFVDTINKYNRTPVGGYFYSAYPLVGVTDIFNAALVKP